MNKNVFNSKAEIEACKAQNYAEFGKLNLKYIREGVENILKLIGRNGIFDEYTLHDMTHIDLMLDLLETLIPPETVKIMTPADWLLIVLSCYFHDLGMLVTKKEYKKREESAFTKFRDEMLIKGDVGTDYKDALSHLNEEELERFYYQEFVRHNHADRISYWITGKAKQELGASHDAVDAVNKLLDGLDEKLRNDLSMICRSHHLDNIDQIDTVYVLRRAYAQAPETHANLQYCALLLRTADLLQIQRNRTPSIMFKLIDPANPKSQDEWSKQEKVRAILTGKSDTTKGAPYDTIEVQAEFDKASGFFGLIAYLQYARFQLEQSAEWADLAKAKGSIYEFPWRHINDDQVEARGFLPQKYQFTLDREKILNLLTGHTLYNDSSVAIREILQNAIDAVRFQYYLNKDVKVGQVQIEWNPKTRRLVVHDNGVGMTLRTIENHLLNIGSSYYQEPRFREKYPDFSSISRFGIGVVSYFMISNDVQILSVHPDEQVAHAVTLPAATQRYLIKLVPKDHPDVEAIGSHGTKVSLTVRRSAELEDIEKILTYWIVIPRCNVILAVEGEQPKQIGYPNTEEALKSSLKQSLRNQETMQDLHVTPAEAQEGIELAYAARFSRWFKVWSLVTRASGLFDKDRLSERFSKPPGVCVEGIRVSSTPLGYTTDGLWMLTNLTGHSSVRTNVARSDLEQSEELKVTHSRVYQGLTQHVSNEFDRLVNSGEGITKAAIEADFLTDQLLQYASDPDEMQRCIDKLPIFMVEDSQGRKIMSRQDLRHLDEVWTVDSLLIDHIDGLCESGQIDHPSTEILKKLTGKDDVSVPFPRLIGKRISALHKLEISSILIDMENGSVAMKWSKQANRWLELWEEIIRRSTPTGRLSLARRMPEHLWNALIAIGDVACNNPAIKWVVVRGLNLFLTESPVAILWEAFGGDPACFEWIGRVAEYHEIHSSSVPALREDLRAVGADPDAIIPRLSIKQGEIFDTSYFVRKKA